MAFKISDGCLVKKQTTWGTEVTPDLSVPILGGSWAYNPTSFTSERVRSNLSASEDRQGFYNYSGTLDFELTASGLDIIWWSFFGDYTFSADTPVVGANTHTHVLTSDNTEKAAIWEKGLTLEVGSDGKWYTFDSVAISKVTLTAPKPGTIKGTLDWIARDKTEAATGETYAPSTVDKVFDNFQLAIAAGVDASEVTQPYEGFTLELDRGLTAKFDNSAKTAQKWVPNPVTNITGSFTIATDATERAAVLDDLANSDEMSIVITATSSVLITGSTYYTTTIDMPECKYTGVAPAIDQSDRVEAYSFKCGQSGGATPITVANVNADATL